MNRMIITITMLMSFFLTGCSNKMQNIVLRELSYNEIPNCYESNRNLFGELTGTVFKCGSLTFYSQYTYEYQNYIFNRKDGLYVTNDAGTFNYKIADGVICSIVVRSDGVYYLKLNQRGEQYLYNFDLYRYSFDSMKNELVINDCSFVQFSNDSVFYCQHYLCNRDSYIEKNIPLNLKNEGKIVKHSLVTNEETIVAEIDGNIYNFLISENAITFSGGSGGNLYYGGENLYMCDYNGNNLRKLSEYKNSYIKVLYSDIKEDLVFFSINTDADNSMIDPSYCCMDLASGELIWTYPWNELQSLGAIKPFVFNERVYFCKSDSSHGPYNEIICLTSSDIKIETIKTPTECCQLFIFGNKLYGMNPKGNLFEVFG